MTSKDIQALLTTHQNLTHTENVKVSSHVQREDGDWYLNTLMIDGIDVPFKYRRKQPYKNLKGARVNLTYYPQAEEIAGVEFEYMKVVRLRIT
ncbi:hypothetical protein OE749_02435 [Aestuariibacter sp. AA17]|uniref:Uncharacterized protein n=1 Tax=Fluctibacter corallii TaxID=2984329 RepID=A0ABT3A4F2_9ALTE|nr:hypothetical protein [Aestuariibacter sp. AA17]MCV2883555.1 hypothetical protein [Aestuariibacter sp. AA17]